MGEDCKCCQATPAKDLEDYIMNSNIPKNEQEWWAHKRILELKKEIDDLRKKLQAVEKRELQYLDGIHTAIRNLGIIQHEGI